MPSFQSTCRPYSRPSSNIVCGSASSDAIAVDPPARGRAGSLSCKDRSLGHFAPGGGQSIPGPGHSPPWPRFPADQHQSTPHIYSAHALRLHAGAILAAMLIAGLNYNNNLGIGVRVSDVQHGPRDHASLQSQHAAVVRRCDHAKSMRLPGAKRCFEFELRNESSMDRRDIEIRCMVAAGMGSVAAREARTDRGDRTGRATRRDPRQPVRVAHPLSVWLVLFLDLCARLHHRLRRAGAARQPGPAVRGRARRGLPLRDARR